MDARPRKSILDVTHRPQGMPRRRCWLRWRHESCWQTVPVTFFKFEGSYANINGIEIFWNQVKRHMRKFNGVPKHHFQLFLKECEWRINAGSPKQILRQLRS